MRSPRVGSSAKSARRCRSPSCLRWAWSAFHARRSINGSIFAIALPFIGSAGGHEVGALGGDHVHELVPGVDERLRAFVLELTGEGVQVDAGAREPGQDL